MKPILFLLVIFLCMGPSCKKDKGWIIIEGYTSTDALGNAYGQVDFSD